MPPQQLERDMRLGKCQLSLFNFGLKTKSPEKKGENTINPM